MHTGEQSVLFGLCVNDQNVKIRDGQWDSTIMDNTNTDTYVQY